MLSLISFILVSIGALNWFSIGILQYDFVAGIFGSQSNIFSRLIYTLVGIACLVMIFNLVKNRGKFVISLKKENEEYEGYVEEKRKERLSRATEASKDYSTEADSDYATPRRKENMTTLEKKMSDKDDM